MRNPTLLIIFGVISVILGFAAASTAPFHSPGFAARFQCPRGNHIEIKQYHASWNAPGETGISITCVNAEGTPQGSRELETRGFWILTGIYFLVAFAVLLLAAWLITSLRHRRD